MWENVWSHWRWALVLQVSLVYGGAILSLFWVGMAFIGRRCSLLAPHCTSGASLTCIPLVACCGLLSLDVLLRACQVWGLVLAVRFCVVSGGVPPGRHPV